MTDRDRQRRRRERMQAQGLVYFCAWMTPEQREAIRAYLRDGRPLPKRRGS